MKRKRVSYVHYILLTALCLSIGASCANGQILVGPVAGGQVCFLSFYNKDNKDLYKIKPYYGFNAGGSISFRVRNDFFLQTSVLYSQKGKHMKGREDSLFNLSVKYRYIDVPILFTKELKVKFGKDRFYKIHLGIGPDVSYWLGGKGVLANSDLNENGINPPNYDLPYHVTFKKIDQTEVAEDEMNVQNPNRIQLGMIFSAGAVFEPDKFNRFMVSAQYTLGHSFLSPPEGQGDFGHQNVLFYKDDLQTRFHVIAVSVAYFLDLNTEERKKGKSTINEKKPRR